MAGRLDARVRRGEKSSRLTIRFEDGAAHVTSDDVVTPALQLWRARRALKRAGARPVGLPVTLKLGSLPRLKATL
ncbi:MAG: hypothetical protein RIE77_10920 [Phycisphaerales bacterium]|jgi:hypothetical protein